MKKHQGEKVKVKIRGEETQRKDGREGKKKQVSRGEEKEERKGNMERKGDRKRE